MQLAFVERNFGQYNAASTAIQSAIRRSPRDYVLWEEAAKIDGCSLFGIFWRIILPLSKPALATLTTFVFMGNWNSFMWPLIVINGMEKKTLPVGLLDYTAEFTIDWRGMCALAVVMIIPALVLTFIVQKHLVGGLTSGAVKG